MQSSVLLGAAERVRTLAVHRGAIWIWPGIALTYRCGTEVVPVSSEVIGFWITRLHGPEALYKEISSAVSSAACLLKAGDEIGAQGALDRLRLTVLSADGVALMRALSDELGIEALDLQVRAGLGHGMHGRSLYIARLLKSMPKRHASWRRAGQALGMRPNIRVGRPARRRVRAGALHLAQNQAVLRRSRRMRLNCYRRGGLLGGFQGRPKYRMRSHWAVLLTRP